MALAQARHVQDLLLKAAPEITTEIVGIPAPGDRRSRVPAVRGARVFHREIDRRLLDGRVDLAVHSMTDVPGDVPLPEGVTFGAYLPRDDVRDVVVFRSGSPLRTLADAPPDTVVGTTSVRRTAQLLRYRPDLRVRRIRDAPDPADRLDLLDGDSGYEALVLPRTGLDRVNTAGRAAELLPLDMMCPPVGAGVTGVQCRVRDTDIADLLYRIDDGTTRTHVAAERTLLHGLRGHGGSPIAGHCHTLPDGRLSLRGMVFTRDGRHVIEVCERDDPDRPTRLGTRVSAALLRRGARALIDGPPR
ncbi:hydroxymethylbilane synthase [Marinitenerispora sediminis]|uniref:Hydroxymethylbilane synthase n=2 Tax=Marinitenerispora sediminis TaxID=1931232 RepID=A0A368SZ78_9ACTN|nr:hydroxymethylbilane synthase [Marinitenerispora sediminis]RCV50846.1 hydroxymethylbilane synthase [Marinitenerispora sediminis]RCV57292.1 hydroxymethylbilane synthase [Marinitenerispora sediminis]